MGRWAVRGLVSCAMLLCACANARAQTGLVAAYSFDQGSGTTLTDVSGNGNTGTISGATWNTGGRFGSALSFNGTNSWVTVGDASSLHLTTGMTIEAWIKPTTLSGWRCVVIKEAANDLIYVLYAYDNAPRPAVYVNINGQTTTGAGPAPALNAWTHLAATYDGASLKLYTNGTLVSSKAQTGAINTSTNPLRIGGDSVWGEYFSGLIDEVRVYNRALSQAEIQTDMNTPVGSASPPPPDTTPPVVSLAQPADGSTVSGTVNVTASASDNVGVVGVQFLLDGGNLGNEVAGPPYSVTWDTTTSAAGTHVLTARARDAAGNQTTSSSVTVTVNNSGGSNVLGQWSAPVDVGIVAVNMVMMHTGKILMFSGTYTSSYVERVFDPVTSSVTLVPNPYYNLFCAGQAQLPDGRILVAGGYDSSSLGAANSNIFDPVTQTWSPLPNMAYRRWYPSTTTLGDGRVLVSSGGQTCLTCLAPIPEVFDPATNKWTQLTNASWAAPYYPFMYLLPDGRVLDAGANEQKVVTRALDVGAQTWTTIDPNVVDGHSSAMYRLGKIIKTGTATDTGVSSGPSAATAYVIDMTQPSPAWRQVPSMAFPRAYQNTTLLPDGTVLVTGGGTHLDGLDVTYAVKQAELWSPDTETWSTLAAAQKPRLYHSTALLLPDARVLVGGSGNDTGAVDQTTVEIFSPPYLFRGARPTIASAPAGIGYGASFSVQTPDAANIGSVVLLRPSAVTHAFNQDQRYVPLTFQIGSGVLTVQSPANANLAPPGYYMLFVVNSSGVPSVAAWVQIQLAHDSQPPSAPTALSAQAGIGTATLTWTASTDDTGVARYDVYRSTASGFTPSASNKIGQSTTTTFVDTVAMGTYYYLVTAEDVAGNMSAPSNEASATIAGDTTPPTVTMTAPAPGATVSGTITLAASATDDVGVVGVQFLLDGSAIGSEDTSAPYSFQWNSATTSNGTHVVSARARDAAGHTAQSDVTVSVNNTQQSPAGLVAAYSFNEGVGVTVGDSSGNNNAGTISNATWTSAGKYGSALKFNGTNARIDIPDSSSLHLSTGMTLEAWINPSTSGGWRSAILKEAPTGLAYALYGNNNASRPAGYGHVASDVAVTGTAALPVNTWTHVAVTFDGSILRLYVSGVQVKTQALVGALVSSTGALRIGGNAVWGEYFAGMLDEVRIYNRALSGGEIQADMGTPLQ